MDRIGWLVGDLLAFARRDDGFQKIEFDLTDACRDALGQVGPLCEAGSVHVETDLENVVLSADRDRVARAHGGELSLVATGEPGTRLGLTLPAL
ncbi:MAG: hypothetical protein P8R42_25925 [Candidatus Binatia bacterium]|nr:hypothetical protein [Candidatus Binatia bacterium]